MTKKALDDKYSYQIDEHNVVHLFRRGVDWQEDLTNPLISAIFKIEELEKENAELKENYKKRGETIISLEKQLRLYIKSDNKLTKATELLKKCYDNYDFVELSIRRDIEQFISEVEK